MGKPKPDLPTAEALSAVVDDQNCLTLRVTPGAKTEAITIEGAEVFARVHVQPQYGAANEAVRKLIGKALGIAPSQIELIRGVKNRNKTYKINDIK